MSASSGRYRRAQARRLLRFCREQGLDPAAVTAEDLAPILDADGKILPEQADF